MLPLLIALTQWGDKWVFGENNEPLLFVDREQGKPISTVVVRSEKGEILRPRDIMIQPGPGSTPETRKRIEEIRENE